MNDMYMLASLNLSYCGCSCFVSLRYWIPSSGAVVVLPVQKALMVIQSMHLNVQVYRDECVFTIVYFYNVYSYM